MMNENNRNSKNMGKHVACVYFIFNYYDYMKTKDDDQRKLLLKIKKKNDEKEKL